MIDAGNLSHEEAARHPLRSHVFSCLGGDVPPHIEVSRSVTLQNGDLIALCTDGAWSPLGETLATELGRAPLNTTVPHLLDAAEQAAGPGGDNLTLIALRWEAPDPGMAADASVSDTELEQAIAAIRRRLPHNSNGAS
jgi:serine/threonine protein phosphatase PrpC